MPALCAVAEELTATNTGCALPLWAAQNSQAVQSASSSSPRESPTRLFTQLPPLLGPPLWQIPQVPIPGVHTLHKVLDSEHDL